MANKEIIECSCGAHLLWIQSEVDRLETGEIYNQEFHLAAFNHGSGRGFWQRIKLAFKVIKTGEMHVDQFVLNHDEAKKLSDFIVKNMIK